MHSQLAARLFHVTCGKGTGRDHKKGRLVVGVFLFYRVNAQGPDEFIQRRVLAKNTAAQMRLQRLHLRAVVQKQRLHRNAPVKIEVPEQRLETQSRRYLPGFSRCPSLPLQPDGRPQKNVIAEMFQHFDKRAASIIDGLPRFPRKAFALLLGDALRFDQTTLLRQHSEQ